MKCSCRKLPVNMIKPLMIKPLDLTTVCWKDRKQRNVLMIPRGHNQQSPEYGESDKTDDLVSSIK